MTQFRIDVVVNPSKAVRGTRAVAKGLTDVQKKANKAQLAIQKLFVGLTVVFAVKQLAQLGDAFTNLQNRLRVVTDGNRELQQVTQDLLDVANRSRSAFESTAELYSRLALATRELNLEGANLIKITESINKAIILSGASAKEANNGLIQLSQGLASGRLTGDELRSTLEQLPVVADVIAKQLGVTRGELRKLGAEGKITSIEIIRAFVAAEKELEAKFGKTVKTLSQSFVVLRNNVVAFVGRLNEATGVLRTVGNAVRFVGTELASIVKVLALIGVTAGLIKLAPVIQSFFKMQAAIKAGTAVRLGSIIAINMQNKFLAQQAVANLAAAASEVTRIKGVIFATRQEVVHNKTIIGKNAAILALAATEQALIPVRAQLTAATLALAKAEAAHAAAATAAATQVTLFGQAAAKAKAAVIGFTKALARNPITVFFVAIAALVSALLIFRNDIKLTEDGLATFGDFISEFVDQAMIAFGVLKDFFLDIFQPLIDEVKRALGIVQFEFIDLIRFPALMVDSTIGLFLGLAAAIIAIMGALPNAIGDVFVSLVNVMIDSIEFLPDVFIGVVKTIGQILGIFITGQLQAFDLLARSAEAALQLRPELAASLAKEAGEVSANAFEQATTGVGERFVRNIKKELEDELIPRLTNPFEDGFGELGTKAAAAFFGAVGFSQVGDFVEGLIKGAEGKAADRAAALATKEKAAADKQAGIEAAKRAEAIAKILKPLADENLLLRESIELGAREAGIRSSLRDITEKLAKAGVKLNFVQNLFVEGVVRQNAAMAEAESTAKSLQTADQVLIERMRELNNAWEQGTINLQQLNEAQREAEIVALESSKNFADGWEAGLERAIDKMQDFGAVAQEMITTLVDGLQNSLAVTFEETFKFMADTLTDSEASWVDYREAIKASFKGLIDDLLRQLAKLLAQKALLALLEGLGSPGAGSVNTVLDSLDNAEHGTGAARANKPFIVGEEGIEIFTPGQTGSITPTDQTIAALTGGAANQRETVVVQAQAPEVNVNTIIVRDPNEIPAAMQSPDGRQAMRNMIREDRSGIKRDLG